MADNVIKTKWEAINDERNKYEFSDPKWHKVRIETPYNFPLGKEWKPDYCVLSERYKVYMDHIKNYEVRSDDIWIVTYPKSGIIIHLIDFKYLFIIKENTP